MAENLAKTAGMISEIFLLAGHDFNVEEFNDRLLAQKGVYLLNLARVGPEYKFTRYVRGPYSRDLANAYYKISEKNIAPEHMDIPEDVKSDLKYILSQGLEYTEALATLLVVAETNENISGRKLVDTTIRLKPHLKDYVEGAYRYLEKNKHYSTLIRAT